MELLDFKNLDLDSKFVEVFFDGVWIEGFYVETYFDYDEEEDLKNNILATNITFWEFKIFKADAELITFNDRETKKIKQMIELKLIESIKID